MIFKQNYHSLKKEIEKGAKKLPWGIVQKAYSSPHFIVLKMRRPGESYFVYLARGSSYQGLSLQAENVPPSLRVIDSFLEYIRKNIVGSTVLNIEIDSSDKIIFIHYIYKKKEGSLALFWKGALLYISNIHSEKVFNSWQRGIRKVEVQSISEYKDIQKELFDILGRKELVKSNDAQEGLNFEDYLDYCSKLYDGKKIKRSKEKKLKTKISNIDSDILRLESWRDLEKFINTKDLTSLNKLNIDSLKIDFRGLEGHYKKREKCYQKIKAFKKGIGLLKERRISTEDELSNLVNIETTLDLKQIKINNPLKLVTALETESVKDDSSSEYCSYQLINEDLKIYFGKTAKGNDFIRNKVSNKNDWWVHIDGYTGSHCIIKSSVRPSLEVLNVIGAILRDMGGMSIEVIPMLICQVKNLKAIKGAKGKVIYKNEKRITVNYDKMWNNLIRNN